jgi:prepilin-type processing-associated H-X9-DG protein
LLQGRILDCTNLIAVKFTKGKMNMNDNQYRLGFTIIELTVTILISSLLVSLAIPAVQRGRAKTRIIACKNNLKYMGIAMHSYHSVHNQFPPAWIGMKHNVAVNEAPKPVISAGNIGNIKSQKKAPLVSVHQVDGVNHVTWQNFLLPFLEQENLYDEMRTGLDTNQDDQYTVWLKTPVNAYMCPDDTSDKNFEIKNDKGVALQVSRSNYGANFGGKYNAEVQRIKKRAENLVDCEPAKIPGQQCRGNGALEHNGRLKISDFTDGTTNTILLAERVAFTVRNSQNKEEDYRLFWGYYLPNSKVAPGRFMFETIAAPNSGDHYGRFGSVHSGGAQVCFTDGSVRFVADQVDATLMQKFGTRDGNEEMLDEVYTLE